MAPGQQEDFTEFARAVSPMLLRTAWLLTGQRAGAEDLVQETLARVFVRWGRRTRIDNPAGYARTVLVRIHVADRRRRSATEVVTDRLPEHALDHDHSATLALHRAVAGLSPKDRAVLVLRYFSDLTVAETAVELRMSESAVRTRASRAVGRLRERLGDEFLSHRS